MQNQFEALEVSLLMVEAVRPVISLLKRCCPALADQLERPRFICRGRFPAISYWSAR